MAPSRLIDRVNADRADLGHGLDRGPGHDRDLGHAAHLGHGRGRDLVAIASHPGRKPQERNRDRGRARYGLQTDRFRC